MSQTTGRAAKRQNLGRGLSALLGDRIDDAGGAAGTGAAGTGGGQGAGPAAAAGAAGGIREIAIDLLRPGRFQPRRHFDEGAIDDLVESVREKGILQPILVRPDPDADGHYEIIAGERRWRAAQRARLHAVPVTVQELDDREALEVALVENLQRQDLSPLEEAEGYRRLLDEFGHSQEDLARALGKSRSHVANTLRLLALPDGVKTMLGDGHLTAGHARALLGAENPEALAREVVAKGLNVRQTERLAQQAPRKAGAAKPRRKPEKDADTLALERDVSAMLGLAVTITARGEGGEVSIRYDTLEQLDDILRRLGRDGGPGAVEASAADDEDELAAQD